MTDESGHGARDPDLVPRIEAAKLLGLTPEALSRAEVAGDLARVRNERTRRVYFRRDELEAYRRRVAEGSVARRVPRGSYWVEDLAGLAIAYAPLKRTWRSTRGGVLGPEKTRYLARYRDVDGKVKQVGTIDGEGKAKAVIAKRVAEINGGTRRRSIDGATIGFLCENWPFGDSVDPASVRTNQERVRSYVIPYLPQGENTPLSAITSPLVYKVQDALLKRGLAKRMVDAAIAALKTLWRDASRAGIVELSENPAVRISVRPDDARLHPDPTREHRAVSLHDLCSFAVELDPAWVARCMICRIFGLRPGEFPLFNLLNWAPEDGMIRIRETLPREGPLVPRPGTKGNRPTPKNPDPGRWVPCPPAHIEWMMDLQPRPLDGYAVRAPKGGFYAVRNFYHGVWTPAMDAAVKKSGIVRFDLYDLRHSFASYLHAALVPPADIQEWMGHTDPRSADSWLKSRGGSDSFPDSTTSRVYIHATNTGLEAAIAVLTDTIDAIRDAVGRPTQLRLISDDDLQPPSVHRVGEAARAYAASPAKGIAAILGETLPLRLPERVPITVEIAASLTADEWQDVIDAYSPTAELRRRLRAVAPTNRAAKRQALLAAAVRYNAEHGHLRPPRTFVSSGGLALGKFIQNQRQAYRRTTNHRLTPDQVHELDRINPSWRQGIDAEPPAQLGSTGRANRPELTVVEDRTPARSADRTRKRPSG